MASLEKARTICMTGEVQYYPKETNTWNSEEEWKEGKEAGLREREVPTES